MSHRLHWFSAKAEWIKFTEYYEFFHYNPLYSIYLLYTTIFLCFWEFFFASF